MKQKVYLWGLQWYSKNIQDGVTKHLLFDGDCKPLLFRYRKEALSARDNVYGYIRNREDLRNEPYGWRLPRPVKITSIFYNEDIEIIKNHWD